MQYRMQLGNRCNYDRSRVDEDGGFFLKKCKCSFDGRGWLQRLPPPLLSLFVNSFLS